MPEVGDVLPFAMSVRNAAGALADAGSVTIAITRDGVAEPGSPFGPIASTTTGNYDKDYAAPAAGTYVGYWLATGANACSYSEQFDVQPADPRYIVSLQRARKHLNISVSTASDEELRTWIAATTRVIESDVSGVGPVLVRTITGERHGSGGSIWLRNPPVLTDVAGLAALAVDPYFATGTSYVAADLLVTPGGRLELASGGAFSGTFAVTYQVGRRVIPPNISAAALIVLGGLWETQRGASELPLSARGGDELASAPGMAPVMWRAKELLAPDMATVNMA